MKIMIVEDHKDMRNVLKQIISLSLGDSAESFIECESGEEAVTQYRRLHPDYVFMDLQLKKMDGFRAIELIHQHDARANVIMVTSSDTPTIRSRAKELNVRNFVCKDNLSEISHILQTII